MNPVLNIQHGLYSLLQWLHNVKAFEIKTFEGKFAKQVTTKPYDTKDESFNLKGEMWCQIHSRSFLKLYSFDKYIEKYIYTMDLSL